MSPAKRPRLKLESLDDRVVPATLNLTTSGAQGFLNSAFFSQLDPGALGSAPTHTFARLQEGSLFGSLLTPEEGYNTDARPLQFDAVGNSSITHSLKLGDIPLVTVGGVQYREFLMTVNQPQFTPNIDLQELRIFLSSAGNLTGYNTNTDRLAGLSAAYNLDANGNNTVRVNDNLNRTSSADVRVLIPQTVFAGSDPATTYVYLYSKFSSFIGTSFLSGAESWAVVEVAPPASGPVTIGGIVTDINGNPLAGVTITLSGVDAAGNNLFPEGDLTVTTGADGTFSFNGPSGGVYQLSISGNGGFVPLTAVVGDANGNNIPGEEVDGIALGSETIGSINLADGANGSGYGFIMGFGG